MSGIPAVGSGVGRHPNALYFNELVPTAGGDIYLAGHLHAHDETGERMSRIVHHRAGAWRAIDDIPGIVWTLLLDEGHDPHLRAMTREGIVREFSTSGTRDERVDTGRNGYLWQMIHAGGTYYAAGGNGMVFRRDAGTWSHCDAGVFVHAPGKILKRFMAIDGRSPDDLYAVGGAGLLARYDGVAWTVLASPTNYNLHRVLVVAPDEVYLAGNRGAFFHGDHRGWTDLSLSGTQDGFWGLARHAGKVYACTITSLYELTAAGLVPVDTGLDAPVLFYRLATNGRDLWATTGQSDVLRFDGTRWERLRCPEDLAAP